MLVTAHGCPLAGAKVPEKPFVDLQIEYPAIASDEATQAIAVSMSLRSAFSEQECTGTDG